MTDARVAREIVACLWGLGVKADVEPIKIRYRDLNATIGYEVVVELPIGEKEVPHAGIRAADQDDQRSEPPV